MELARGNIIYIYIRVCDEASREVLEFRASSQGDLKPLTLYTDPWTLCSVDGYRILYNMYISI